MDAFTGKGSPLTRAGFDAVVNGLGADAPSMWALVSVETCGFGFLPDRRPKILYERHIFHRRTGGRFDAVDANLSAPDPGGYRGGAAEYDRLAAAMRLDETAALESASWGLGQVMGFNAVSLGYSDVRDMVSSFTQGEDLQFEATRRFIEQNPQLKAALRDKKWDRVAFFYNGPDFAKNDYDTKLDKACALYTANGVPSLEVRTAQACLTFLGFDPHGVDGIVGTGTRNAITAFQRSRGLAVTSDFDERTLAALEQAMAT